MLHVISQCPVAHAFFAKYLGGKTCNLVFHMDEGRLGNILRPDIARSFVQCSWTFSELPMWFRAREGGWFPLAELPSSICKGDSVSPIFVQLLKQFFCTELGFDFEASGISVDFNENSFHCFAKIETIIVDEKQHKEIADLKGALGLKFCAKCMNAVRGRTISADDTYLVDVSCGDTSRFKLHTAATLNILADHLEYMKGRLGVGDFKTLETNAGLTYNPRGLLWNREMRRFASYPEVLAFDPMHNLYASGGIAQYQINKFALDLTKNTAITLEMLDKFSEHVCSPKGKLNKQFWQSRVVAPEKKNKSPTIRAFASEVIIAIGVLMHLSDIVLVPAGVNDLMSDHIS